MNNLAINISNAPAKSATSQPTGNDDMTQQDGQGFGNVLTRQVAEADKPAESTPTSGKGTSQAAKQSPRKTDGQGDTETVSATDSTTAGFLPADMLAALLAQQNLNAIVPTEVNMQPVQNAQTSDMTNETAAMIAAAADAGAAEMKTALPGAADMKAVTPDMKIVTSDTKVFTSGSANLKVATPGTADMKAPSSTMLIGGNAKPAESILPVVESQSPKMESTVNDSAEFAEALRASFGSNETSSTGSKQMPRASAIGELANTIQQPVISAPAPGVTATASPISISTPVTQAAWGDEFSQKITWMVTQRNQSAELHLNPPQLGPLDVVLKINGDQATAMFTSSHAAVRDAIEQALPKLREILADNGIMLGNATVSDQTARNNQEGASTKSHTRVTTSDNSAETAVIPETRVSRISRHNGVVDTFA